MKKRFGIYAALFAGTLILFSACQSPTASDTSGTDIGGTVTGDTVTYSDTAPVSITTTESLVAAGKALSVDASALTSGHAFTWDGSAETDGTFSITAGSINATITGGSGADTIVSGTGTNWICGGPGSDTITLSSSGGADTLVFNSLTGVDSISNFNYTADTLKLIVSTFNGYLVSLAGTTVTSTTGASVSVEANHLDGNAGTPIVLIGLSNTIASSTDLMMSLAILGTNQLTFPAAVSAAAIS